MKRQIRNFFREIKWAYQRVRWGISDRDGWGLSKHLVDISLIALRKMVNSETNHLDKEILYDIIDGLSIRQQVNNELIIDDPRIPEGEERTETIRRRANIAYYYWTRTAWFRPDYSEEVYASIPRYMTASERSTMQKGEKLFQEHFHEFFD